MLFGFDYAVASIESIVGRVNDFISVNIVLHLVIEGSCMSFICNCNNLTKKS